MHSENVSEGREPLIGSSQKSAALIVIGNEILSGRTKDTNTAWIAETLQGHGVIFSEVRVIADDKDAIIRAVHDLRDRYDYVFTTGGIGPTHDDTTAECIAAAFDTELERNQEALTILEEHYGLEDLTPPRAKMCMMPKGAKLIPNPVSAAPGFIIGNVYVMAGVPKIMQAMFDFILQEIDTGTPILSRTITCGLAESVIAPDLGKVQEKFPALQIGSYPNYKNGVLGLSLVVRGTNEQALENATREIFQIVESLGDTPKFLGDV